MLQDICITQTHLKKGGALESFPYNLIFKSLSFQTVNLSYLGSKLKHT